MTSHAALVAALGQVLYCRRRPLHVDIQQKIMTVEGKMVREGEIVTLNGTKGRAYKGALPMISGAEDDVNFATFMKLCDSIRRLKIRTNAETPKDAAKPYSSVLKAGLFRQSIVLWRKQRKAVVLSAQDDSLGQ